MLRKNAIENFAKISIKIDCRWFFFSVWLFYIYIEYVYYAVNNEGKDIKKVLNKKTANIDNHEIILKLLKMNFRETGDWYK